MFKIAVQNHEPILLKTIFQRLRYFIHVIIHETRL